jgi:hypothetical protein
MNVANTFMIFSGNSLVFKHHSFLAFFGTHGFCPAGFLWLVSDQFRCVIQEIQGDLEIVLY